MGRVPSMKRWPAALLLVAVGTGLVLVGAAAGAALRPEKLEQIARPVTCVSDAGVATISVIGAGTRAPTYASNAFSAPERMCQGLYPSDVDRITAQAIDRLQAEGASCGTITFTNGGVWTFEGTAENTSVFSFPTALPEGCSEAEETIPLPSVPASVVCQTPDEIVVYQRERDADRTCRWIEQNDGAQ